MENESTQKKTQLVGQSYLDNFKAITRTPYGYKQIPPSMVEAVHFDLTKQLAEIRNKLDEITGLINAPRQGDYSLQSGVWRKWHSEKEQSR